jgi:hypothetical protein
MPQKSVAGPCREPERDNHLRIGPTGITPVLLRDSDEGRIVALKLPEPGQQIALDANGKASPDSAGEDEIAALVIADQKRFQITAAFVRDGACARLETMPSRPSPQACRNAAGPLPTRCSE